MTEYTFTDQLEIEAPKAGIHDRLWRVELWPQILPHVVSVEMLEQRPGYQRFSMETRAEQGTHRTQSVRESDSLGCIRYRQLILPPILRSHRGRWLLEGGDASVLVTAEHTVELDPSQIRFAFGRDYSLDDAQLLTRHFIGNHSMKTLNTIRGLAKASETGELR